ncbi:MAG: hypothetical protein KDD70_06440, partial [Bdellovibrionales bacterium]|nr:hypothetical protein [Bdellovibrionales bacterium]
LPTVFLATINGASVEMEERWPAPAVKEHPDGGLSYEYQRSFAVVLGPFRSAKDSQKEIRAEVVARWLACSDQLCIPKKVPATVSIPVSATGAVSKSSEYLELEESLPELTSLRYEVKQAPLGDAPLKLRLHPKGEKFGVLADDTVVMAFAGNRLKYLSSSVSDSESLDLEFSIRNPAHPPELKGLVVSGFFVSRTGAASRAFLGESQ